MSIVSLTILSSDLQLKLCSQDTTVLAMFFLKDSQVDRKLDVYVMSVM